MAGPGVPVLPLQPAGGSRAQRRAGAGGAGAPPGRESERRARLASGERRPRRSARAGAEGRRCRSHLPGTGRREESSSGVAVAQSRSRVRGLVRALPASSLPLRYTFRKRCDLAESWGETSVPCAGWQGLERAAS